jgi:hypothetical protein
MAVATECCIMSHTENRYSVLVDSLPSYWYRAGRALALFIHYQFSLIYFIKLKPHGNLMLFQISL